MKLLSRVRLFVTPWTAAYQAPPFMGFSRQEHWSGVPSPSPLFKQFIIVVVIIIIKNLEHGMEKAMAPHSSTLAWKIPWMEEPGRLQSMGSLRVRHD